MKKAKKKKEATKRESLKACPVCGGESELSADARIARCLGKVEDCPIDHIWIPFEKWQQRPKGKK